MAKKSTKKVATGLMKKLGGKRAAFDASKQKETKYSGGVDLPSGIKSGIAQLIDAHFGEYESGDNKGEPFLYMAGTVIEPKEHAGVYIEGARTDKTIPLTETKGEFGKSFEDNLDRCLNELRKLGVPTAEIELEDLEATVEELMAAKPYFRFRTWSNSDDEDARVMQDWRGIRGLEEYEPEEGDDTEDDSEETDDEEGTEEEDSGDEESEDVDYAALAEAADNDDEEAQMTLTEVCAELGIDLEGEYAEYSWGDMVPVIEEALGGEGEDDEAEDEPEEEEEGEDEEAGEEEEEVDYAGLGAAADDGDEDAQAELTSLGEEVGVSVDDYAEESWTTYAEAIAEAAGGGKKAEEEEEEEEEASEPKVGDVCLYKPPKARKFVECEVLKVMPRAQTVTLKNLADGKSKYTSVAWDKLKWDE